MENSSTDDPNADKNQISGNTELIATGCSIQCQMNESIHPIQGCPSEILQYIFEWTYHVDSNPFKASTALSHVCRRWRAIALKTPYIWTNAVVSLDRRPEAIEAFWSRTVERAKIAPMTIIIKDMTGSAAQWPTIENTRFDLFTNIAYLKFHLVTHEASVHLYPVKYFVPRGKVDHLEIHCEDLEAAINTSLLRYFPPLTSLTLYGVGHILCTPFTSFPTITQLTLKWTADVPYQLLMITFPNVEELTLILARSLESPTKEISFPKLWSLRVGGVLEAPWTHLNLPSLTHLIFMAKVTDSFLAFVTSHNSIQHLDTGYLVSAGTAILAVISATHQLTDLTIAHCEELSDLAVTKLRNLRNLVLYQHRYRPLSLDLFERIVRSRFLPLESPSRKAKEVPQVLASLTILVKDDVKSNELEWRGSSLLSVAPEVSKVSRWNDDFNSYTYTWT